MSLLVFSLLVGRLALMLKKMVIGDVDDDVDDDGDERQPEWLLWYSAWLLGLIEATLVINHHIICQTRTTIFPQTLN